MEVPSKMIFQLNPMIPVRTPKGDGFAFLVIDYSQEHHTLWTVMLDAGFIFQFETKELRVINNESLGRINNALPNRAQSPRRGRVRRG